jgi:hypothetical protein
VRAISQAIPPRSAIAPNVDMTLSMWIRNIVARAAHNCKRAQVFVALAVKRLPNKQKERQWLKKEGDCCFLPEKSYYSSSEAPHWVQKRCPRKTRAPQLGQKMNSLRAGACAGMRAGACAGMRAGACAGMRVTGGGEIGG